ncbi:helix-turn-helix domain-containing protein [Rhizobium acaciae]|uniref:helix-turn-helix domain-containing protein n=1 Tax=Rhizobium acaciae TaxID=2989736 RepID=UPI0038730BD7
MNEESNGNEFPDDGSTVLAWCRQKDISLRELSKKVGLEPSSLSLIAHGRRPLSLENATKIAEGLEISLDDLRYGPRN